MTVVDADTITDAQIRGLRESAKARHNTWLVGICNHALSTDPDPDVAAYRGECRARCAEILNRRNHQEIP